MLSDPTLVWRTVACDLARYDETFAETIVGVLKGQSVDPDRPDIASHFEHLIKQPLIDSFTHRSPPIIVIDALDECGSDIFQTEQRRIFVDTLTQWSSLPGQYKLIVTGRNERVPNTFRAVCKEVTLPVGTEVSESANNDIRHFFEARLAELGDSLPEIHERRIFDTLTARAAGLFIWAETAVRFVEGGVQSERLKRVLSGGMGVRENVAKLYRQVLELSFREADDHTLYTFGQVVATIILAKDPLHEDDLSQLISQQKSSVTSILNKLSSVITIRTDQCYHINHSSFSEFLCSELCPKKFYINLGEESSRLSMACFRLMRNRLRFNICDLETSSLLNHQVDGLSQRIQANIPSSLVYSCQFWASHFQDAMASQLDRAALMTEVTEFFDLRFLHWLEVMSLTEELAAANIALLTIVSLIKVSRS
jgi:hypothetical protein